MKLVKRMSSFIAALVLSVASLSVAVPNLAYAAGNTCSWTGGAADGLFSSATNWSGCAGGAPTDDDMLVFDNSTLTDNVTVTNDLTGLSVVSMTFNGSNTDQYTIAGNAIEVTTTITTARAGLFDAPVTMGGAVTLNGPALLALTAVNFNGQTVTFASDASVTIEGLASGVGTLLVSGVLSFDNSTANTWTGSANVGSTGAIYTNVGGLGASANIVTVQADGFLTLCAFSGADLTQSLVLAGDGAGTGAVYSAASCSTPSGSYASLADANITGDIQLNANTVIDSEGILNVSGDLTGSYTLTLKSGAVGQLVINAANNTSLTPNSGGSGPSGSPTVTTVTYSDSQPTVDLTVLSTDIVIVTGTRGDVTLSGGVLKGTGTVGTITMSDGEVAPGMSPGVLNSGNTTFTGGQMDVEIGGTGAGEYDQLNVTGTVSLGSATELIVTHWQNFRPEANNTFTIINNDGSDAVTGTFQGLAEGATITVDSVVYKISYVGGDGNDVVLTAQTVPSTPDTGLVGFASSNPVVVLAATLMAAAAIVVVARRQQMNVKVRR